MVVLFYLSTHAWLHAGPHPGVAHVLHLHAHALPRLVHELMRRRNTRRKEATLVPLKTAPACVSMQMRLSDDLETSLRPEALPVVPAASAAAGASWVCWRSSSWVSSCQPAGAPFRPSRPFQGSFHLDPSERAWARTPPAGPGPAWGSLCSWTAWAWRGVPGSLGCREASDPAPWPGPGPGTTLSAAQLPESGGEEDERTSNFFVLLTHSTRLLL